MTKEEQRQFKILKRKLALLQKKKSKKEKTLSYSFSQITLPKLQSIVNIKLKFNHTKFDDWFNNDNTLKNSDKSFLESLITESIYYIGSYQEEDLKIKFIGPILNRIHFTHADKEICDFYDRFLTYKTPTFIFNGKTDFMVAKGYSYPKIPYFFIQEFKTSTDAKDPQPQLLAELIAAIELNKFSIIKGAYIIGIIWHFVILEKLGNNKYQYFISKSYDSTDVKKLQDIYKNLLYVKQEIFKFREKHT